MFRSAVFAVFAVALSSSPVLAQVPALLDGRALLDVATSFAEQLATEQAIDPVSYLVVITASGPARPRPLIPLYAAQAMLQGLDVYTTARALAAGNREANPFLKNTSAATVIGAKLATTALGVLIAERLWKKNPKLAVVMMVAVNGIMSGVVINNARVLAGASYP